MLRGTYRRGAAAWLAVCGTARTALMIAGCGLAAAGCSSSGQPVLGVASPGPATVAFESIDGPPETVFRKLVLQLDQEASARQVAVVSREQPAQYRIRSYVAAHTQGKRSTIVWVWDIYNVDRQRTMRLAGEVAGAAPERNAWAAADDQAIGRIARDGMDRLVAYLAAPNAPGDLPGAPPAEPAPNVAFGPAHEGALAYLPPLRSPSPAAALRAP